MGLGSILIGLSITLVVVAYLARPFVRAATRPEQAIEHWVAQARAGRIETQATAPIRGDATEPVNYCPQCGRRAGPDDRFCAGCGTPLREG